MHLGFALSEDIFMRAGSILGLLLSAYVSSAATYEYYVLQDPHTRECHIVSHRPTEHSFDVVGDTMYRTLSEAASEMRQICGSQSPTSR